MHGHAGRNAWMYCSAANLVNLTGGASFELLEVHFHLVHMLRQH
jgi:hypothetical protein